MCSFQNEIVLIGHSSGAHLCLMSVIELLNLETPGEPQQSRIKFDESYFNNKPRTETLDDSSGSSASFCVVNDKSMDESESKSEQPDSLPTVSLDTVDSSISTSAFEVIKSENNDMESLKTDDEKSVQKTEQQISVEDVKDETEVKRQARDIDDLIGNSGIARPKELEGQVSFNDLSKSIKVVIGRFICIICSLLAFFGLIGMMELM